MNGKVVPEELQQYRKQIDAIDEELMTLLARRFDITSEVGRLKAERQLESLDPVREEEKLQELQRQAEQLSMNPAFVLQLFEIIFTEVVANHRRLREEQEV